MIINIICNNIISKQLLHFVIDKIVYYALIKACSDNSMFSTHKNYFQPKYKIISVFKNKINLYWTTLYIKTSFTKFYEAVHRPLDKLPAYTDFIMNYDPLVHFSIIIWTNNTPKKIHATVASQPAFSASTSIETSKC